MVLTTRDCDRTATRSTAFSDRGLEATAGALVDAKKGAPRSRGRSAAAREPFPPSRRRRRGAVCDPGRPRQRERATPPAPLVDALVERGFLPAELWADRGYDGAELRRQLHARRRAADQPAPPPRSARPGRHTDSTPREPPPAQDPRPTRTPTLARRTHQRLAAQLRRVATRWERRPDHWLAVIQIAAALTIWETLQRSFR